MSSALHQYTPTLSVIDARGMALYDEQIRPLSVYQQLAGEPERCVQCFQYGDSTQTDSNCCGRPIRHDDPAGSRAFPGYDLPGKGVAEVQRFLVNMNVPDWPESFVDRDALLEVDDQGAPVTYCTAWRHDAAGGQLSQVDALGILDVLQVLQYMSICQSDSLQLLQAARPLPNR
jgi:insecticidal toxin complex protein TccC